MADAPVMLTAPALVRQRNEIAAGVGVKPPA